MPAVIATGLDYSARRLTGKQIREAGYKFVNRYLWFPGQRWPSLTAEETADLLANDVEPHAIYEQNTDDPAGGFDAGVRMATQAVASAKAANLPAGSTIYMCADAWLSAHGISIATAMRFLDGASSVIRPAGFLAGAYGFADFVFAAAEGGHADRFWLCGAELPDEHRPDWLHMYQWNNGRVFVDGLSCDLNKQYLPMKEEDDVSADDVLYNKKIIGPDGKPTDLNLNDFTYWTNFFANMLPAIASKLDAMGEVVGEIAKNDDRIELTDAQADRFGTQIGAMLNVGFDELAEKLEGLSKEDMRAVLREFRWVPQSSSSTNPGGGL